MFRPAVVTLTLCLSAFTAQAALLSRAGGQAYYDDVLDITWLADANLAASETFGLARNIGYPDVNGNNPIVTGEIGPDGRMSWDTALLWIDGMNAANYLGASGWRMPTLQPLDGTGSFNSGYSNVGAADNGVNISAPGTIYAGSTAHEMANLYYNTLEGNVGGYYTGVNPPCITLPVASFVPACFQNPGPFENLLPRYYWEGLAWSESDAWVFIWKEGYQGIWWKDSHTAPDSSDGVHTWAVLDGDALAVIPAPPAVWLFGSALGVMGWMRRKEA